MTQLSLDATRPPRAAIAPMSWAWLGVVPFFLFAILFLILPTAHLVLGAFQDNDGHLTFANIAHLFTPQIISSFLFTIQVSAYSAIGGAIIGLLLAYAGVMGGLPKWVRPVLMTFCGVAPN